MYKKIITFLTIFLFLTLIPLTMATPSPQKLTMDEQQLIKRTFIRGLILFPRETDNGDTLSFFAIRLHFRTITVNGDTTGNIRFRSVPIPNTLTVYSKRIYIIGTFHGDINVAL